MDWSIHLRGRHAALLTNAGSGRQHCRAAHILDRPGHGTSRRPAHQRAGAPASTSIRTATPPTARGWSTRRPTGFRFSISPHMKTKQVVQGRVATDRRRAQEQARLLYSRRSRVITASRYRRDAEDRRTAAPRFHRDSQRRRNAACRNLHRRRRAATTITGALPANRSRSRQPGTLSRSAHETRAK